MLSWILTAMIIVGFAAATLELFREDTSAEPGERAAQGHPFLFRTQRTFVWQSLTDADLDALMGEFVTEESRVDAFSRQA